MKNSREEFLNSVRRAVEYWSKMADSKERAAEGVAFSIMCLLDGVCVDNLAGYKVIDNETGQQITERYSELHADL